MNKKFIFNLKYNVFVMKCWSNFKWKINWIIYFYEGKLKLSVLYWYVFDILVSISKFKLYVIENNCMNWISSEKLIRFKNVNFVVKI